MNFIYKIRSISVNISRKISYLVQITLVRVVGFVVKKDKNVWIFGGSAGTKFADNSMYFYKYIKNNHPEIDAIWVTNSDDAIKEVEQLGGVGFKMMSFKALPQIFRASVYVSSHFIDSDIYIYDDRNTLFINLWHGMPIKKIVYDEQKFSDDTFTVKIYKFIRHNLLGYRKPEDLGDLICSTSEYTKTFMESAFRSDNVKITGQLRGDVIYNFLRDEDKVQNRKKTILYMPTPMC